MRSCKYVYIAITQDDIDKLKMREKIKFDILFVGDDWYQDKKWVIFENELKKLVQKWYIFHIQKIRHQQQLMKL